jgi:hypothetical protein
MDVMGGACSTDRSDEKCIYNIMVGKPEETTYKT